MEHSAAGGRLIRGTVKEKIIMMAPAGEPGPRRELKEGGSSAGDGSRPHETSASAGAVGADKQFRIPEVHQKILDSGRRPEVFLETCTACVIIVADSQWEGKTGRIRVCLLIAAHSERHTKQTMK